MKKLTVLKAAYIEIENQAVTSGGEKAVKAAKKVDKRIVMHEMARCRSKWSGKQQEFGFV